jgi:hypothetical protein
MTKSCTTASEVELVPQRSHMFWNESTCVRIAVSILERLVLDLQTDSVESLQYLQCNLCSLMLMMIDLIVYSILVLVTHSSYVYFR